MVAVPDGYPDTAVLHATGFDAATSTIFAAGADVPGDAGQLTHSEGSAWRSRIHCNSSAAVEISSADASAVKLWFHNRSYARMKRSVSGIST